ncbi:MAG: TetR/AcrR family transcriptional regulator [Sandaracinus sp.]
MTKPASHDDATKTRGKGASSATKVGDKPGGRAAQKASTREAILAAARATLARGGLAATTTRRVAEEAGVAVGTVFLHFPDTSALVEALLDAHLERALAQAYRTVPANGTLVEQLVHVAKRLYDSYAVEPELSRAFIAGSLFPVEGRAEGAAEARLRAFEQWVMGRVAEAVSRGEIPAIEPALAFGGFFSLYFGLLVAGLRGTVTRREQVALLSASLSRLFRTEVSS